MITVNNLHAKAESKNILCGVHLSAKKGEVHAIMGPNGSGKSTFAKIIAGDPCFDITQGTITYSWNNKELNLLDLDPTSRAQKGIFLGFQYPIEIAGISNLIFLRESFNEVCRSQGVSECNEEDFKKLVLPKMKLLEMGEDFLYRPVNTGFSGGEKKKNEILQMMILSPRLALLDETDSGLDVDALRIVAKAINSFRNKYNTIILVTHYQRLLCEIKPDKIHIFSQGRIIKSGGPELADVVEKEGYVGHE